jgi:cyanophycinase
MRQTNAENPSPVPQGILVIIGGKEDKGQEYENGNNTSRPEILERFIKLIEKDNPVIDVISSASSEGEESFEITEKHLKN